MICRIILLDICLTRSVHCKTLKSCVGGICCFFIIFPLFNFFSFFFSQKLFYIIVYLFVQARGEEATTLQESTRKLIDTQTQVAKATAEAAKYLTDARSLGRKDGKPTTTTTGKNIQSKRRSNEAGENDDTESQGLCLGFNNKHWSLSWQEVGDS